jgi:DNA-binding IclR family transcriptional regulator
MKSVELALFVVEKTRDLGRMDGSLLARCPGWDRVKAHRYLTKLAALGWLERVNDHGYPIYVLGRKPLSFALDLRRID